jgi:hypothetical protein
MPQVARSARANLSRWRHGFEPRWDYQEKRRSEILREAAKPEQVPSRPGLVPQRTGHRHRRTPRDRNDTDHSAHHSHPRRRQPHIEALSRHGDLHRPLLYPQRDSVEPQGTGAASQHIEISDVTLPIAALLIASVFEELDGCRIGHRSAAGGQEGQGSSQRPMARRRAAEAGSELCRARRGYPAAAAGAGSSEVSQPGPPSCLVGWGNPR